MKNIDSDVIEKIQKLLNLSDTARNSNIEEAQTAMLMAHRLLDKHHLSMSQIMALDESGSDNSNFFDLKEVEANEYVANALPKWLKYIIEAVNLITETRTLIKRSPRPGSSYGTLKIVYVGDVVDALAAKDLFEFFRETVSGMSNKHVKQQKAKFKNWRSFAEGCSSTLLDRAVLLKTKNQQIDDVDNGDLADKLSIDNFEVEDDQDEVPDDMDDIDDESITDESGEYDAQNIEITEENTSLEIYKKYQDTKFEKISEFINQLNIEDEQSSSRSSRVDCDSFVVGKKAGEKIPLKVVNKLSSDKTKKQKG